MSFFYAFARLLLSVFPDKWNNKDTQGAVMGALLVSFAIAAGWMLFGCAGYQVNAEYEHHSSIPDVDDLNTTDQAGLCVEVPLSRSEYATLTEICMHKELDHDKPVFGHDPVGTIRLKQPLYIKH